MRDLHFVEAARLLPGQPATRPYPVRCVSRGGVCERLIPPVLKRASG